MGYGYESIKDIDKSIIDWSGLTKNISDNLIKESERRDKLKSELAKTNQEELNKLNEFEQGMDPSANKWILEQAQQARQYKLQNYKMMTQGLRSVDDSKLVSQNVMDGWSNLNSALKTYNQNFKIISESPGKANTAILEEMADFMNLKNKKITYDPKSGESFIAEINPADGKIIEGSLKPIRVLNSVQAQKFDMVDLDSETTKISRNTAAYDLARSGGASVKNPRLHPVYKTYLDNSVKSIIPSEEAMASVLLDHLGFDYTRDKNEEGKEVTYTKITGYNSDGIPETELVTETIKPVLIEYKDGRLSVSLTDKQKKLAEETVKTSIESKLAVTTKSKPIRQQNTGEQTNKNVASLIENFVSRGDFSSLKSALSEKGFVGSKAPNEDGVFKLIDASGKEYSIQTKGKTAQQVGEEIAGALKVGKFFKDRGVKGDLSSEVTNENNKSNYNIFVTSPTTSPKITQATYALLMAATTPTEKFNAAQAVALELGIPTSKVGQDDSGNIKIEGVTGNFNTSAQILEAFKNIAGNTTTNELYDN